MNINEEILKYFVFLLLFYFSVHATSVQLLSFEGVTSHKEMLREKAISSIQKYTPVVVVERKYLKNILDEQYLQETGITKEKTAIGEIAAADEVIACNILEERGYNVAVFKRVSVRTSELVHTFQFKYKRLEDINEKELAKGLFPTGSIIQLPVKLDVDGYMSFSIDEKELLVARSEVTCGEVVKLVNWAMENLDFLQLSEVSLINKRSKKELISIFDAAKHFSVRNNKLNTATPQLPAIGITWYGAIFLCNVKSLMIGYESIYNESYDTHMERKGVRLLSGDEYNTIVSQLDTSGTVVALERLEDSPVGKVHSFFNNSVSEWIEDRSPDENEMVEEYRIIRGSAWYHKKDNDWLRQSSMRAEENDNGVGFRFVIQNVK